MPALSLFPTSVNTERTVLWEFISDGSIESLGFSLSFEEISCFCGESLIIIPCQGIRFYDIMNRTDGYYCGNLNCNFTIILDPECENQSEIIKMEITLTPDQLDPQLMYIYDIFRIIVDNVTILEINYANYYRVHTMFLYANSSNIFQVITASDLYAKNIFINFGVDGPPIDVSTIMLTNDIPYFAYHLCENKTPNLFNIQLSPELKLQNASIEMYSTFENIETAILFFNNESITHKINFENW
uniref:CUB domain-containing protein n=1 Tax=Panagrolaimus sp. PS1159 TaxID=55785 RepID=A0AC35FG04_9BILA